MENQESSVNLKAITADDINMEDIVITSTQSADKASGTNKSQITALALNLLSTDNMIHSTGIHILEMKPCNLCKQKFTIHPCESIKEFTIGKPTSSTADVTKPVDLENQTPTDDVTLMNELGLLGGKEQSSSKTTDVAKETSDQATRPIEVVSTTSGNSKNVDDSILKDSSRQVQYPICEKCSENISIEFTKVTVFLSCKYVMHYECINNLRKKCSTCPAKDCELFPVKLT
ncbi:hypothetical protein RclHR1_01690021 [Rhizophagus clarus]|uniref:RING-type domain-containing protein n=1 Tax=Rhizophagus clarus TaxID=94130 RepID=A0A2Z6RBE0_9GLOM|nr:hypothetical protein RclHR1_01690021 [Rhizophagus clarus]